MCLGDYWLVAISVYLWFGILDIGGRSIWWYFFLVVQSICTLVGLIVLRHVDVALYNHIIHYMVKI